MTMFTALRFIREAQDNMGPLYVTIGRFDPSLWDGTDALIARPDILSDNCS